ncbi:unnamed protein product [Medioppia subpectinata]|uniref:Uncharacterized protein n=1 Tax=Medioppia subpectinata TaxID=1979941 RepID=A0A7R9PYU2_9ACAR|nr:unnamed protein product [Medioppia subpectinata]CAG2106404.1 unnamed protein product [Medioppia subpectinata]
MIRPQTPRLVPASGPQPVPHSRTHQLQRPINVDITQSPTYQMLQEEEEPHRKYDSVHNGIYSVVRPTGQPSGQSPKHSHSPIGLHSPAYPTQTPYFRSLMNSLLPNPGF